MGEAKQLQLRLAAFVTSFSFQFAREIQSGALVQLWCPCEQDGQRFLTTEDMPFAIMGTSDQLALYKYWSSKYRPSCDGANTSCAISRVFANLPPQLTGKSKNMQKRMAEAQRCGIHSCMFLPVYDNTWLEYEACSEPAAVLELSMREKEVDFKQAVQLLRELGKEQSFWVPCLKSARVVDSCEAPLEGDESAAAAAAATSSSHGGGSASEGQLAHEPCTAAAAMRRSNCLLAQLPAQAGGMDAPPAELRHSQPVIVTDYLQFSVLEEVPEEGEDEPGPGSNLITAGMGQQQQQQHPHPLAVIITDPRNGAASSAISLPPLPQTPGAEARRIRSDSGRGLAHGYAPQQWQQPLQPGQEDTHQHDQEGHAAFPDGQPHSPFGPLSLQRSSGSIGSRGSSYAGSFSSSFNAGSFSSSASQSRRVRALVAHGGSFKHTGLSGLWEYVGGAQKLVGLSKHASMGQLQAQLAAQAAAAGSGGMLPGSQSGSVRIKYVLPASPRAGAAPTYVDLEDDEDVESMWEEVDEYLQAGHRGFKLQLYVESVGASPAPSGTSSLGSGTAAQLAGAAGSLVQLQPNTPVPSSAGMLPAASTTSSGHGSLGDASGVATSDAAAGAAKMQGSGEQQEEEGSQGEEGVAAARLGTAMEVAAAQFAAANEKTTEPSASGAVPPDTPPQPAAAAAALESATEPERMSSSTLGSTTSRASSEHMVGTGRSGGSTSSGMSMGDIIEQKRAHLKALVCELKSKVEVIMPQEVHLVRLIGGGAFGEVYLSRWHGVDVAVKCLSPSLISADHQPSGTPCADACAELLKEAAVLASLHHPNIVSVFGVVLPTDFKLKVIGELDAAQQQAQQQEQQQQQQQQRVEQIDAEELTDELLAAAAASFYHQKNDGNKNGDLPPGLPPGISSSRQASDASSEASAAADAAEASGRGLGGCRAAMASLISRGHPPAPSIMTEYLSLGSLRNAISGRAEWLRGGMVRAKLMLDTARGLEYLHSKHLVHFDLKSANLLVTMRDKVPCVKVADMGLTKQRRQTYVTGVNSLRGTLPWIAPEILKNPENVTEKADCWSFGVVMWELWAMQEPFEGIPLHALLHQLATPGGLTLPVPGTSEWQEDVCPPEPAPGWCALMRSCWLPQEQRPSSCRLVAALEEMMERLRAERRRPLGEAASAPAMVAAAVR